MNHEAIEKTVTPYLTALASDNSVPGGGSALAMMGATACALIEKAMNVTAKKLAKQGENVSLVRQIAGRAHELSEEFIKQAENDDEAFKEVITAMNMPCETAEEKAARKKAMEEAYLKATDAPLAMLMACCNATACAKRAINVSDAFIVSDCYVAKRMFKHIGKNVYTLVDMNIAYIPEQYIKEKINEARAYATDLGCNI